MSRAQRLLQLLEALRRRRRPAAGAELARELGVSLRTLYRDVASLQAQGANIAGEAGLGYVLRPGFTLPPLMFSAEEVEALTFGASLVAARADGGLAHAARGALSKIAAVLPRALSDMIDATALLAPPGERISAGDAEMPAIRAAIRAERALQIAYVDAAGGRSEREVWPLALAYFDHARVLVAWCVLRNGFRNFRIDRIAALTSGARYPRRRIILLREWREQSDAPKSVLLTGTDARGV